MPQRSRSRFYPPRALLRGVFYALGAALSSVLLALLIFAGLAATGNEFALREMGNFLWERPQLSQSDILYVLGGDYLIRIPHAARLYTSGLAPKIVIPRENMPDAVNQGSEGQEHFTGASVRILLELGVPRAAIEEWKVGAGVTNTAQEMRSLATYVDAYPSVSKVILVTSSYHTRRAAYTARRMLPWRMVIQASGVEGPDWNMKNWWIHPIGRATIWDEYKKLLFYVPRYLLG